MLSNMHITSETITTQQGR